MVGSVPPDKDCEVLDGELTHEKQDKNNLKFADSNDIYILLKWKWDIIKCYEG